MKHEFDLVLGDWSDDGHGKSDKITILSDKSVKELQDAYRQSCESTKLKFHEDICKEYEDREIDVRIINKFKKLGCTLFDIPGPEDRDVENVSVVFFTDLLMWFIGLSIEFVWEIKEIPVFNGYWGNLNEQFGYGLYY